MSSTVARLCTFFIGVPAVVFIIVAPWMNHLMLHLVLIASSFIASLEMTDILAQKMHTQNKYVTSCMAAVLPLVTAIGIQLQIPQYNSIVLLAGVLSILISFSIEVFPYGIPAQSDSPFSPALERSASTIFTVFYCGLLMSFISRITEWEHATSAILLMILLVFGNDSLAWLFGMLFGKNSRGIVKASPNKSLAGFTGGFFSCLLIAYLFWRFVPTYHSYQLWKVLIIGGICSITAIFGDLVESVFKRSGGVKDSGKIIPGRGGLLDSTDSILFTAPVFYLVSSLFFN